MPETRAYYRNIITQTNRYLDQLRASRRRIEAAIERTEAERDEALYRLAYDKDVEE